VVELKGSIAALGAVGLLAVGALVGSVVLPEPAYLPSQDKAEPTPTLVTVGLTQFNDPRTVSVTVTDPRTRPVLLQGSGMVTADSCEPGLEVRSGDVAASLNGRPLVLLATKTPLWRDLKVGDRGSDVRDVADELARLGYLKDADRSGTLSLAISEAMHELLSERGGTSRSSDPAVPLAALVWLPSRKAAVLTCEIDAGQRVEPGDPWATLARVGATLRVADLPEDAATGPRTLVIDEVSVPLDENDQIDAEGAKAILESDRVRAWRDAGSNGKITGTLELSEPIPAGVVPPAAVFAPSSDTPCLVDGSGTATPIEVLASQLGSTLVRPRSPDQHLPQHVQLDIDGAGTCA
jgi:hypothetical protein